MSQSIRVPRGCHVFLHIQHHDKIGGNPNDGRKSTCRAEGSVPANLRTAPHITMTDTSCIQSVASASPLCKKSRSHTTRTTSIKTDLSHASRPPQPPAVCTSSSQGFRYNNTTSSHRQQRKQESKQTHHQSLTLTSTSTSCTFELDSSRQACDKSVKLPRHTHYTLLPLHGQLPMARRGWLGIFPPEMRNQLPGKCWAGWLSGWLDG